MYAAVCAQLDVCVAVRLAQSFNTSLKKSENVSLNFIFVIQTICTA